MAADHAFLRSPQRFAEALSGLRPAHWPPGKADLDELAHRCTEYIASLDAWESETHGRNVVDIGLGAISTAHARRILAREIAVSDEGEIAVLLVPAAEHRVRVELRARVDAQQGLLRRPEFVLDWTHDGREHVHYVSLTPKGPEWYMLSQLRDDLWEDRLGGPRS
ncbi:hypothetical protein [Streptomyces sp. MMS24-I29]|uniref:hypothetical protein n=1 Tax=Streptomyces sp. MMS24-I29 TaxID=3351480 RepID=UPI003C7B81F7